MTLGSSMLGKKMFNNVQHLVNALKQDYNINEDWMGSLYYGIHLDWHYDGN